MVSGNDILERIFERKREEVAKRKAMIDLPTMRRQAESQPAALRFGDSLRQRKPALIAEIKRTSPSKGDFGMSYSAVELAQIYLDAGAAAISVLTDREFFRGNLEDLQAIASLRPRVPILRKDFLCDPYQIYEARACGADAVLLIASYLKLEMMQEFHDLAEDLGMCALVEVHTATELELALQLRGLKILGVNNRNLHDFSVNLETCLKLKPLVPADILFVAESGIRGSDDVHLLLDHGIHVFLVGETLVRAQNPTRKVKELLLQDDEN